MRFIQGDVMKLIHRLRAYFQAIVSYAATELLPFVPGDAIPGDLASASPDAPASVATPVLACTAQTFRPMPAPSGLEFVVLSQYASLPDVQEGLDTNAWGFDPAAPAATETDAKAFRAQLITNRAFTAKLNKQPAAAGMFTPPIDGIAELVGMTTLAPYRRRGVAAALTSEIVRVAFVHQVDTVILQTNNPVAYRVYQRIGFLPVAMLAPCHRD
jgi:GNAT superfamily N-acetyltransferase